MCLMYGIYMCVCIFWKSYLSLYNFNIWYENYFKSVWLNELYFINKYLLNGVIILDLVIK